MTWVDIVVIAAAVVIVGLFFGVRFWRKKTGRSKGCGCCSDCSSCSYCSSGSSAKPQKEE